MKVLNVLQNQLILKQAHSLASSTSLFSPISYFGEWNACFCSCPSQNQRVVSTLLLPHSCSHQPLNPDISTGYLSPSSNLPALLHVQSHCHGALFDHISLESQKQSPNSIPFLKSNVFQTIIFFYTTTWAVFQLGKSMFSLEFFQFFPPAYSLSRKQKAFYDLTVSAFPL